MENFFGIQALLISPIVIVILLIIVPFVDRNEWLSPKRRKLVVGAGLSFWILMIVLGLYAYFSPVAHHVMDMKPQSNNFQLKLPLVPQAFAHGEQKEMEGAASSGMAMSDAMHVDSDQTIATQAVIIFAILLSLQIGLIIIREAKDDKK